MDRLSDSLIGGWMDGWGGLIDWLIDGMDGMEWAGGSRSRSSSRSSRSSRRSRSSKYQSQ